MNIHSDFTKRAVVHAAELEWVASPMAGVERKMLDRVGGEVARATSIVRYAPGSKFSSHIHNGGEEFFVLDGVFQDEHADYPSGSYVRNPPNSSHTPGSQEGCTILVKLWQFDLSDRVEVNINTNQEIAKPVKDRSTVKAIPLFQGDQEDVRIEEWPADKEIPISVHDGLELFVLEGSFEESGEYFFKNSWLRLPPGEALNVRTGDQGAVVWIKSDHLRNIRNIPEN